MLASANATTLLRVLVVCLLLRPRLSVAQEDHARRQQIRRSALRDGHLIEREHARARSHPAAAAQAPPVALQLSLPAQLARGGLDALQRAQHRAQLRQMVPGGALAAQKGDCKVGGAGVAHAGQDVAQSWRACNGDVALPLLPRRPRQIARKGEHSPPVAPVADSSSTLCW